MLILHPRDQPPIGGAYQPADWDAPLADDPFFSLSLSREREKKRKKPAAETKRRKPQTFVRSTTTRRAATLFNRVRRTSDNKVQTRRSTFDRSSRIETNRSPRVARAPFHSVQFSSVPLFVARTLTARLTVSVAHLRSISRVSSVRGALTTRGVASSSPRPSPRGFFFGRIFVRGVAFIRTFGHLSRRWIGKP